MKRTWYEGRVKKMKTDKQLFDEYQLEHCYVISYLRMCNGIIQRKQYLPVHEYWSEDCKSITFHCEDNDKVLFNLTFDTGDIFAPNILLKSICIALTKQSEMCGVPILECKFETSLALNVVIKQTAWKCVYEHFIYKWSTKNKKQIMTVYHIVDKALVPLKKKIIYNPDEPLSDYELLLKCLKENGLEPSRKVYES